jgi:hypothetical protein
VSVEVGELFQICKNSAVCRARMPARSQLWGRAAPRGRKVLYRGLPKEGGSNYYAYGPCDRIGIGRIALVLLRVLTFSRRL